MKLFFPNTLKFPKEMKITMSVNSYPISANILRRGKEDDPNIICSETTINQLNFQQSFWFIFIFKFLI